MEVGDYVRFDYHRITVPIMIAKIIEKHLGNEDEGVFYTTDTHLVIDESNLVKEPSPDIIDLIEVGDYVNGYEVIKVNNTKDFTETIIQVSSKRTYCNDEIKSIVTKEQFKSMEYKIK